MMKKARARKTTVGSIDPEVLAFTAGKDVELDINLIEVDCIGTAAHVTMLSKVKPSIFTPAEVKKVKRELAEIVKLAEHGKFKITLADQDVHMAVERTLTKKLGDIGKKVHTARSRNDQVAVDIRLYAKQQLIEVMSEVVELISVLLRMGKKHVNTPMVGRTHMQPAMPSSVGLWATAHAESLLLDLKALQHAFEQNDSCPLGSAAGYGVPINIDRQLVSDLLGFEEPSHNVLYASNSRGKIESAILGAMSQVMISISRIAQDIMLYTMPEFNYFSLAPEFCTGSSIMPNKNNPDVMELIRAKTAGVLADSQRVSNIIASSPSGYNRDIQEAKEPFINGMMTTNTSVKIMAKCISSMAVNKQSLLAGFNSGVYATDAALELVAKGMPFRDAYHHVKSNLASLDKMDPKEAIGKKTHLGATSGLDFNWYLQKLKKAKATISREKAHFERKKKALLG